MIQDYKILMINAGSFGISMTNIDITLKIILLLVTIGYTINKFVILNTFNIELSLFSQIYPMPS